MKKTIGLMALMAVLMVGIVYAITCTVTDIDYLTPGRPIYVNFTFGDTTNTSIGMANLSITGCTTTTFYMQNETIVNNTAGTFNFSVTATEMHDWKDDIQCSLVAELWNWSAAGVETSILTCTTETFYPDNSVPACVHSQLSRTTYNPKQIWTIDGTNASSATIQFGANALRSMTENSDVFTWTGKVPESTYDPVRVITSDGLNETTCDLRYVRIDTKSTIKQIGVAVAAGGQKGAAGGTSNLAIIAIIGIVLFWYVKKNK